MFSPTILTYVTFLQFTLSNQKQLEKLYKTLTALKKKIYIYIMLSYWNSHVTKEDKVSFTNT